MNNPQNYDAGAVRYENFEQVSVLGRALYVRGWARAYDLRVELSGENLPILVLPESRPDVAACFDDPSADAWGFILTALLPRSDFDPSELTIYVRDKCGISNPVQNKTPVEDEAAIRMIDGFLDLVRSSKGSLLEIGSRARSGNSYRSLFPEDIDYVGMDITPGPNVDLVGDAHTLSKHTDQKFDYIFSISVFEHLLMPWKVAVEMNRVLKPGGLAYIQSHSAYPLHDEPWDFWRYSRDAWRGLFNKHTGFEVIDAQYRYPARVVPDLIHDAGRVQSSLHTNHLVSACLVRKIGEAGVEWAADASEVFDLQYSHQ